MTATCTLKEPTRHPCSWQHLTCVLNYRSWRLDWEMQFDQVAIYGPDSPEAQEFRDRHPAPTFRDWLIGGRAT